MKTPTPHAILPAAGLILRKKKVPGKPNPGIQPKFRSPRPASHQPSRFSWSGGPDAVKTN